MLKIYRIWQFIAGLSAKFFTVSGTGGNGYFDVSQQNASPVAPSAGFSRLFAKSDGNLYRKDPTGVESVVGSGAGGSGATNYLAKWSDCSAPIDTLDSTLAFVAGSSTRANPTLWGHSADTNLVPIKVTAGNLSGGSSYQLSPLSDATGCVQTPLFTLAKIDRNAPLTLSIAISGVNASGDYDVVLDRYNSANVYQGTIPFVGNMSGGSPVSAKLPTGTTRFVSFANAIGADTDQFAIRWRRLNAAASATVNVAVDEMTFGSQQVAQSSVTGPLKPYTPSAFTGVGTPTGVNFSHNENGPYLEIHGEFASGSSTATEFRVTLPPGYTVHSLLPSNTVVGTCYFNLNTGATITVLATAGNNYLTMGYLSPSGSYNGLIASAGNTLFTVGQACKFYARIPVNELSANNNVLSNPNLSFDMAGSIQAYAGSTAPKGWALCDGAELAIAAYPDLYTAIGTTWNTAVNPLTGSAQAAPAAGNFRVPNFKGAFLRGVGTFAGTDAFNPANSVTLGGWQSDKMQGHWHQARYMSTAVAGSGSAFNLRGYGDTPEYSGPGGANPIADGVNGTPRTGAETRPQNIGVNYIIRLFNSGLAAGVCPIDLGNIVKNFGSGTIPAEESGTFTATLTGCTTAPTATCGYARVGRVVTISIPAITATSNTTACSLTTNLPATCLPVRNSIFVGSVVNNTADVYGMMIMSPAGTLSLYTSASGTGFTASGAKGLDFGATFSYTTV